MTIRPDAVIHQLPTGNAKHQAAVAARAEQLMLLRSEITESLAVLADLARELENLADSRQRLRTRLVTAETHAIFEAQARRDRQAARGVAGRQADNTLSWMNAPARIGTGQVAAPVETLPAVSVVAEIRYTLRHNIRRLGRPAKLTALEVEQTADEDHGYCPWPRHPILTAAVDIDDQGVDHLAVRLARLVGVYTNRKDLAALKRDLDRLEEAAKDIATGTPGKSAMLIGSETCPHCRRNTLAVLSRVPGVATLVIRCEGNHRCICDDDTCTCHRRPHPGRHEWINSGHATHTFHDLKRAQNKLKETVMLEAKAMAALDVIRALHVPSWRTEDGTEHRHYVIVGAEVPADHVCVDDGPSSRCNAEHDEHLALACIECRYATDSDQAGYAFWPCPTARAADITGDFAPVIDDTTNHDPSTDE